MKQPVFIIAEAGVNHNGDIRLAYALIDAAKQAGVDAIKFQTFKTEKIVTRSADTAEYQKNNSGKNETQFDLIKKLELSYPQFEELHRYCQQLGLCFLSTPDEPESLDFLVDKLDIPVIKIGSGEINNYPYLRQIAAKNRPMILSTGMSTLVEVEKAVKTIQAISNAPLSLLHCTTNYPCPMDQVNLLAMLTMKREFNLPIGYSDHTLGIEVPVAATALGATIIEKHFTLDRTLEGPDHLASLDPIELKQMVLAIRNIESALGTGIKIPNADEEKNRLIVRKRLIVNKDLQAGHQLTEHDMDLKRANSGLTVDCYDTVLGRILTHSVKADTALEWKDLS